MKAAEIRAMIEDFRADIKPKLKTAHEATDAMQVILMGEIAAQLCELNEKLDPLILVNAPPEK